MKLTMSPLATIGEPYLLLVWCTVGREGRVVDAESFLYAQSPITLEVSR